MASRADRFGFDIEAYITRSAWCGESVYNPRRIFDTS